MSFIDISAACTADPGNIRAPKSSFMVSDPFAIVLNVQMDNSVVSEGLLFDALMQIVNPQEDPYLGARWTYTGSDVLAMDSAHDWD